AGGAILELPGRERESDPRGRGRGGDGSRSCRMRAGAADPARTDPARTGMSERFADSARRHAGLVPRALGWRPGEFWEATPAELAAILFDETDAAAPLSRSELAALMERDSDG